MKSEWLPLSIAPQDENILIAAEPDWTGEGRLELIQQDGYEDWAWVWVSGALVKTRVIAWMPLPAYPGAS